MKKTVDFWENLQGCSALAARLDLAIEANALLRGTANIEIPGVAEEVQQSSGVIIHIITVLDERGEEALHRPVLISPQ